MSKVEKISIALPSAMTKFVRGAVESGRYGTTSEVVREALRELQEREEVPQLTLEDLRRLWVEGEAGGAGKLGSFDAIRAEAKRRIAAQRKAG